MTPNDEDTVPGNSIPDALISDGPDTDARRKVVLDRIERFGMTTVFDTHTHVCPEITLGGTRKWFERLAAAGWLKTPSHSSNGKTTTSRGRKPFVRETFTRERPRRLAHWPKLRSMARCCFAPGTRFENSPHWNSGPTFPNCAGSIRTNRTTTSSERPRTVSGCFSSTTVPTPGDCRQRP